MMNVIYQILKRSNTRLSRRVCCKSLSNWRERYDETQNDDELDMFNVGDLHKKHMSEVEAMKEQEKYHIVRRKYFKEAKSPNFLTWADKQQIKHLHATNAEEWTLERLSDGFPALPETIKKIVSSNWRPKNAKRIQRHDATVQRNWSELKQGNLKNLLQGELQNHLEKFTSRELLVQESSNVIDECLPHKLVQRNGEFSAIIRGYEMRKHETSIKSQSNDLPAQRVKVSIEPFKQPDVKLIPKPEKYPNLIYPEHITIPKDLYKAGGTYKLEDCYYDSDGVFLYRVPGLV